MRNIGDIISSNRKKLKLSQPMLAELLQQEGINLTVKAISKWETNATEPSVATFLAVCKVLNITNIYEEYFGANPADPLSSLNDEGKEKALDYIGLLHDSGKYENRLQRLFHFADILKCMIMQYLPEPETSLLMVRKKQSGLRRISYLNLQATV